MWWIVLTVCLLNPAGGIDYATCEKARAPDHFTMEQDCLGEVAKPHKIGSARDVALAWGIAHGQSRVFVRLNCRQAPTDV